MSKLSAILFSAIHSIRTFLVFMLSLFKFSFGIPFIASLTKIDGSVHLRPDFNPSVSFFIFVIILLIDLPLMLSIPFMNLSDQMSPFFIPCIFDVTWICLYWGYFTSSSSDSSLSMLCFPKWLMPVFWYFRVFTSMVD